MPIQTRPRRSIQRPAPVPFFTHSVPDPNLEGSRILRNLVETQINDIDPDYFTNTQCEYLVKNKNSFLLDNQK